MIKQEKAEKDYLSGMKYKDIAEKYGISINTVKSWKQRYKWQRGAPNKKNAPKKQKSMHTKQKKVAHKVAEQIENNDKLTDKRKMFCLFYLQRYNATWAYQQAYGVSYETAHSAAFRLLADDSIKKQLTELKEQQAAELYASANDILLGYLKQAAADINDVIEFRTEKHLVYSKVRDKEGPYEDSSGHFRYEPKIDPETGEQAYYYEHIVKLKDSNQIDTSNIKSIKIDKGEPVVEMYDKQKAMKELLARLPTDNPLFKARIKKAEADADISAGKAKSYNDAMKDDDSVVIVDDIPDDVGDSDASAD